MKQQDINLVPGKQHYALPYLRGGRLFSYAHQMNAVLQHEPKNVLEIGPGPGLVTSALRAIGMAVTTVDVQQELQPDVVASVTALPFEDNSFNVSMCCQVLEHLPLEQLVPALGELARVSRSAVVVSLPDCSVGYRIHAKLPKFRNLKLDWSRTLQCTEQDRQAKLKRDGHYWEIGYPGVTTKFVQARFAQAGLSISRNWRVPEMPYHRFFVATRA